MYWNWNIWFNFQDFWSPKCVYSNSLHCQSLKVNKSKLINKAIISTYLIVIWMTLCIKFIYNTLANTKKFLIEFIDT